MRSLGLLTLQLMIGLIAVEGPCRRTTIVTAADARDKVRHLFCV